MQKLFLTFSLLCAVTLSAFAQSTKVVIETEYGRIVMMLYDNTPKHRDNMIKLANEHYYDSTLWHRVIPQFVIQGGDPNSKHAAPGQMLGDGEYGPRIPAEINDSDYHKRGAVGMARDNNPEKMSSGCQFYIVTGKTWTDKELDMVQMRLGRKFTPAQRETYKTIGGTPHLDGGYTVFGEVVEGMDVVDKISQVARDRNDRPEQDIHLLSLRLVEDKAHGKHDHKDKKTKKKHKFLGIF